MRLRAKSSVAAWFCSMYSLMFSTPTCRNGACPQSALAHIETEHILSKCLDQVCTMYSLMFSTPTCNSGMRPQSGFAHTEAEGILIKVE